MLYFDKSLLKKSWFKIVKFLQNAFDKKYSVILCDEAQDFTKVEFDLILNLNIFLDKKAKLNENDVFNIPIGFAGDPLQTINPTGFSFKNLKADVYKSYEEKTGYKTESLGCIFSKIYPEKRDLLSIYYLCEIVEGNEKSGDDFVELKWVSPEELEKYFTTSFHPNLKEYIINLK